MNKYREPTGQSRFFFLQYSLLSFCILNMNFLSYSCGYIVDQIFREKEKGTNTGKNRQDFLTYMVVEISLTKKCY